MDEGTTTPSPRRSVRERWTELNDWLKAALIALLAILFVHFFVLRWVTVRSTSMYATLLPGDVLGVERWPVWTGFSRGDIAVFRDPLQDRSIMGNRQLLVKRIVGLPGDKVELRDGVLYVNGQLQLPAGTETHSYLVRLKKGTDPSDVLRGLGLPPSYVPMDRTMIELPLSETMAGGIDKRPDVVSAERMSGARGAPSHIFPYSPYFKWNSDDYGPITVPAKGDTVTINVATIPLYDRIISRYEGNKLEAVRNELHINGAKADTYVVQQDYYFVLGDSRHYSADSRYWGFVPADHLVGRGAFVLMSADPEGSGARSGRWFKGL